MNRFGYALGMLWGVVRESFRLWKNTVITTRRKRALQRIGEDITGTLHYRRPVLHIVRKIYPKYVRRAEANDCSDVWAQMHPDSIRTYRREERQEQAARRDRNRLDRRLKRQCREYVEIAKKSISTSLVDRKNGLGGGVWGHYPESLFSRSSRMRFDPRTRSGRSSRCTM